jgi:hypothetical protein
MRRSFPSWKKPACEQESAMKIAALGDILGNLEVLKAAYEAAAD